MTLAQLKRSSTANLVRLARALGLSVRAPVDRYDLIGRLDAWYTHERMVKERWSE